MSVKADRAALIDRLMRFNPFAGEGYYSSLPTRQLEETLGRLELLSKTKPDASG